MTDRESFDVHQAELSDQIARERAQLVESHAARARHRGKNNLTLDDAVSLLAAREPAESDDAVLPELMRENADQAAEVKAQIDLASQGNNGLRLKNKRKGPKAWRFDIAALASWSSEWQVGDTLLAHEVCEALAVEPATATSRKHGNSDRHSSNRELVLGAALAVIANDEWAKQCRDGQGRLVAEEIARVIEQKSLLLFDHRTGEERGEAPLVKGTMAAHINEWLHKTR